MKIIVMFFVATIILFTLFFNFADPLVFTVKLV